jgi:hypothetical protein
MPEVEAGSMRVLAVTATKRILGVLADAPTCKEPGLAKQCCRATDQARPSARLRRSTCGVHSHVNPGSSRPKWPYAAVRR